MVFNVKESEHRQTVAEEDLPYKVVALENVAISMKDGAVLYAHMWVPQPALEGSMKVGTLVEYLPYRKNDFTAVRDSIRHPYYAGHGLALVRVDMRGCGDSDGVLQGEYLLQEQDDNMEVFDWIVKQEWSNGRIGQFGKSWGGFNGLQAASRQHPALKTIITLCSTDDRYADDVHYRGGCILASDMLWWASTMFAYNARPQDPRVRSGWRDNWMQRLETEPNVVEWLKHQRRDDFWKHGSVCENYSSVDVPVLAIGGWRDGYTNAVLRMMENLPNTESRGVIGPWVHEYPEVATPSPGIGYNQLAVGWFSKYLTTDPEVSKRVAGMEGCNWEEMGKLTAYVQEPASVADAYAHRDGRWVSQSVVPEKSVDFFVDAASRKLVSEPPAAKNASLSFSGNMEHGLFRGTWCPFGQDGDFPGDQKIEDAKCLTIDTEPFEDDYEFLGFPIFQARISSSQKLANLTVRLVDLDTQTGENILVSWGMANLSHLNGDHTKPKALEIGQAYDFCFKLDAIGYKFCKGHRLRLAFSTADWPSSWPSAHTPTLQIFSGSLSLPKVSPNASAIAAWPGPEALAPCDRRILRKEHRTREVVHDYIRGTWTINDFSDEGKRTIVHNGCELGSWNKNVWFIKEKDPLSAYNQCDWELTVGRTDDDFQIRLETSSNMRSDETNFYLSNRLQAFDNDKRVFDKTWEHTIARDFV